MSQRAHWEAVYATRAADAVSWYAPHLERSLALVRQVAPSSAASIIDVGGGESTLVDDLLEAGYRNLTVLDLSARALEVTRERLGAAAQAVNWLAADIVEVDLPAQAFDVWHDRAVFHFLVHADQRRRYVEQVLRSVRPGGHVIVGAFGPDGPEQCSGLDVVRYAPDALHDAFGARFELLDSLTEIHSTPWGAPQQFVYCLCRRGA